MILSVSLTFKNVCEPLCTHPRRQHPPFQHHYHERERATYTWLAPKTVKLVMRWHDDHYIPSWWWPSHCMLQTVPGYSIKHLYCIDLAKDDADNSLVVFVIDIQRTQFVCQCFTTWMEDLTNWRSYWCIMCQSYLSNCMHAKFDPFAQWMHLIFLIDGASGVFLVSGGNEHLNTEL